MKLSDILEKKRPTLSFEMFPPKDDTPLSSVLDAARATAALNPDFISVTYGAGGSTVGKTVEIASFIQNELNTNAVAHLTCVSAEKNKVMDVVKKLKSNNVENILALRGDIPEGMPFPEEGKFNFAIDLVKELKKDKNICIGGACYPEGHPECPNIMLDFTHVKEKAEAGCDFLISQLFLDNNVFYKFMYHMRSMGVKVPIIAGIMPVTSKASVERMCQLSGTKLPFELREIVSRYGDNPKAMRQAGLAYSTGQIINLLSNNVDGIHIYSMNNPATAEQLYNNLCHLF